MADTWTSGKVATVGNGIHWKMLIVCAVQALRKSGCLRTMAGMWFKGEKNRLGPREMKKYHAADSLIQKTLVANMIKSRCLNQPLERSKHRSRKRWETIKRSGLQRGENWNPQSGEKSQCSPGRSIGQAIWLWGLCLWCNNVTLKLPAFWLNTCWMKYIPTFFLRKISRGGRVRMHSILLWVFQNGQWLGHASQNRRKFGLKLYGGSEMKAVVRLSDPVCERVKQSPILKAEGGPDIFCSGFEFLIQTEWKNPFTSTQQLKPQQYCISSLLCYTVKAGILVFWFSGILEYKYPWILIISFMRQNLSNLSKKINSKRPHFDTKSYTGCS